MKCPNCRTSVNPTDRTCPKCGFPMPQLDMSIPKIDNENQTIDEQIKNIKEMINNDADNNVSGLMHIDNDDISNVISSAKKNERVFAERESSEPQPNSQLPAKKELKKGKKRDKKEKKVKPKAHSTGLIIVIILLTLLVLALIGYIGYDKFIKKEVVQKEESVVYKMSDVYTLSDQEALGLGQELWNYAYDTVWCKNFKYGDKEEDLGNNFKGLEILNYSDVASNFTKDFTYEYNGAKLKFNDIFSNQQIEDKYYDPNQCKRDMVQSYGNTTLKIQKIDIDKISYTASSTYCEKLRDVTEETCVADNITKVTDKDFVVVKEDNKWHIQTFYLPN